MARTKDGSITLGSSYIPVGDDSSRRRIDDVVSKYNILLRAAEAGRKNEPPTNDAQLDETQRELIDESQGFVAGATRRAGAEITDRCNDIRTMLPAPLDTALEQSTIRREVAETKDRYRDDLAYAFHEQERTRRDLRAFEEENGLPPHSAVYKSDGAMFASLLLALTLCEGLLNAFLFQELQDRGLIGGLMLALSVGLANVLMGLGAGFLGWRLATHVRPPLRLLGILTTALFMAAALALHLALGDLREAIGREAIGRDAAAQIDFLVILKPWRWFAYTTIPPFVLFVVGVATFLIAAMKGRGGTWGIVAPYWGHDGFDRRFQAADEASHDAIANLKDAMQNAFDGERAKLRARHAAERERLNDIRRLVAEAQGVMRTLSDSIDAEIGRLHIWLRMYRDRNRAVRNTPAPKYFETYPAFEEWRKTRLDLTELMALAEQAESTLAENGRRLAALEEKTLQEQVTVIDGMIDTIMATERGAAGQVDKDEASRRPRSPK
ncbi:hypothetical protein [Methylosinus sp. Sm6]|uniref:hypothetical protein n=1 Tax=Methylosinus sp. Sm6 TaxID=2866948 RepID=UPI001C998BA2|nr:hypothetical protein [Methylosinus sp. Sm6]MBY6240053.1 hypothetical protein [Methylosinus sp. Sm6]